ncbi:translocation protein SEC72 [Cryptococcus neoformans Bt63]|nr:translocation protein SEC72 [Cryptococcus neoformans var. grubii Bt63]
MAHAPPLPPPGVAPLSPAHLSLLDALPHTHVPHALKTVTVPANAPPDIAGKSFALVVCSLHDQQKCDQCAVDFAPVNFLHQFLRFAPAEAIPPPPNVAPPPQRAQAVTNLKEAGNNAFKAQKFDVASQFYSKATDAALSRPPWEPAALGREEAAITLCNRSASNAFSGNWAAALADAQTVINLKRPWTKGHFRKARALVGLEQYEDAKQAVIDGLQYEPNDKELNNFLQEIEEKIKEADKAFPDTVQ